MPIVVRPLTAERWDDLEAVFNAKGCSVARSCWCMYYRKSGKETGYMRPGDDRVARNRKALHELASHDPPPGLIGYRGHKPVGWVSLGPREDYRKLEKSRVMKAVDGEPVWSIICFVVPSEFRGQGVARELLAAAVGYARKRGVKLLEAYPVDKDEPGAARADWFGSKRMFDEAGFGEVARHRPDRPIVRLALEVAAPAPKRR
ncbi:MAG TPA: GNAT family N-acetyltransferase [Ramlibacter sp.]|uniref:GNAT family N-acetyltransferase n=1 Tax=Ramlibacter sp. TaxID=1917967 RepID=UPI002C5D4713|nr:GNAT family N-acetyltransferase [Ramlibacter sp.]HVZ45370.1 GNAT family N-acetyltransferase [Ramlibacter sp.]